MEPSYKQFENNIFSTKNDTLHKSHNIGNRFLFISDTSSLDDMVLYKQVPRFKISQITLFSNEETTFGFQIIYHNPDTNEFFAGANHNLNKKPNFIKNSIKIDDDDYLSSIKGRNCIEIDFLRFETKKGKILEGGGSGGKWFEVIAKNDFYFSDFGSTLSKDNGRLIAFHFEELPFHIVEEKLNNIRTFKNFRNIFRMVSQYLALPDLIKIFILNSHFRSLRIDTYVLYNITNIVMKSLNNQYRRYLKNLLHDENVQKNENYNHINLFVSQTANKLINPYGCLGFESWSGMNYHDGFKIETFLTQPYRTHCFAGSFEKSILSTDLIISKVFDKEFYEDLINGRNLIIVGGYIARRMDCPSKGFIKLKVFDEKEEVIFEKKEKRNELSINYSLISLKYQSEKYKVPYKLTFSFGGRDLKEWAGNYGPRFSGLFVRGYKKSFFD